MQNSNLGTVNGIDTVSQFWIIRTLIIVFSLGDRYLYDGLRYKTQFCLYIEGYKFQSESEFPLYII